MKVMKNSDNTTMKGPADWFTGGVEVNNFIQLQEPARANVAVVSFQPGARTTWHSHPLGQLIIVTSGEGWVQKEGEDKVTVQPGDMVFFEPGEKHWHGASTTKSMTHFAMAEAQNGTSTDWMEAVSEDDYLG